MLRARLVLPCSFVLASLASPAQAQLDFMKGILANAAANAAATAATEAAKGGEAPRAQDGTAAAALPGTEGPVPTGPLVVPVDLASGNIALRGKRFYVAEYRLLFEVGGKVTANTRAAYFGGVDRGATRMTVNYQVPQPDTAVLQALTDKAWADFQAQLAAAGLAPEAAESVIAAHGAVYEASAPATQPGTPVVEEVDLGHGSRKYLVFAPTGMKLLPRGFIGIGTGDMGRRMDYVKGNVEALMVGIVVNLAAQESSGSGSSLFKRGSSANASAAMELAMPPRQGGIIQALAQGQAASLKAPLPVPGQFATLRETGGYDSSQDAVVRGIQVLGALTLGVAGNNSKRVDMAVEVDPAALSQLALQGLGAVHKASIQTIR